jgi:hypothetical protein
VYVLNPVEISQVFVVTLGKCLYCNWCNISSFGCEFGQVSLLQLMSLQFQGLVFERKFQEIFAHIIMAPLGSAPRELLNGWFWNLADSLHWQISPPNRIGLKSVYFNFKINFNSKLLGLNSTINISIEMLHYTSSFKGFMWKFEKTWDISWILVVKCFIPCGNHLSSIV